MEIVPAASRRERNCFVVQYSGSLSADCGCGGGGVVMSLMARRSRVRSGPPPASEMPRFMRLREMKENHL